MEKVVIGRKWNNPEISVTVNNEKIELQLKLNDYIEALVKELGSPLTIFTSGALKTRLLSASTKVISEVKTASKEVV